MLEFFNKALTTIESWGNWAMPTILCMAGLFILLVVGLIIWNIFKRK